MSQNGKFCIIVRYEEQGASFCEPDLLFKGDHLAFS
jgi:hypothetical protein